MPYISNSELESRVKKSRTARDKLFQKSLEANTQMAGWQTGETDAAKKAEQDRLAKRSNISKLGDTAKAVGSGIASSYKNLGDTLGTIAGEVSPTVRNARKDEQNLKDQQLKRMSEIVRQRFADDGTKLADTDAGKDARLRKEFDNLSKMVKDESGFKQQDEKIKNLSVKKTAGDIASITTDVLSAGTYGAATKGAQTGRILKAAKTADKVIVPAGKAIVKGAATGAGVNLAGDVVQQSLDNKKGYDIKQAAIQGGLGAVLGGLGAGVSVRGSNKAARTAQEADRAMMAGVDESAAGAASHLNAMDKAAADLAPSGQKLLGTGEDRISRRMAEIDQQLQDIQTGSKFEKTPSTMDNLGTDSKIAGNANDLKFQKNRSEGKLVTSPDTKAGTFASETGTFKNQADEVRALKTERSALQKEADGLASIQKFDGAHAPKLDVADPQFKAAVDNELQAVDNSMPAFKDKPTGKVNALVDYFRTPTKVLERIGLKDTAKVVEDSFEKYRAASFSSNKLIQNWDKRIGGNPDASKRIFNWLDGDKNIRLSGEEAKVAQEMKDHLEEWAGKLGLDKEQRVTDYITHIFEGDLKGKTNDVTLASILDKKGTTKSYNPFTQKRIGQNGYKEDALAAMEAYLKKGNRQIYMDPALKITADAAKNVDDRTARYLLKLNQSIAMKPDKFEQMINDVVSSVTRDKLGAQAGTKIMRGWRNTVYRATLGMNVGSALRNLTQGTNTFAELGSRRTLQGYSQLVRAMAESKTSGGSKVWDEMIEHGVWDDAFHQQDRTYSALSKGLQKADKGLWAMFDTAEKINRGSAYLGAKAKALAKGMPEDKAIEYAKDVVGKTQFRFNDIETPLILRSQAAKTLGQFQSFNIKQAEFLGGTAAKALKGDTVEMLKLARWVGANLAIASSAGTLLGLKWTDAIPDFGTFRGVRSPLLDVGKNVKSMVTGKNEYGQDESRGSLAKGAAKDLFGLTVPGGTQIKKTKEGLDAVNRGDSRTDSGKIRYTVPNDAKTKTRAALFGQYNLDQGQEFFGKGRQAFTHKQTDIIDAAPSGEEKAYEDMFNNMREKLDSKDNTANKIKEEIKNKNFAKAKRLSDEHNSQVEAELAALSGRVGRPSKDIVDYIRSTYKTDFEYYKRKKD